MDEKIGIDKLKICDTTTNLKGISDDGDTTQDTGLKRNTIDKFYTKKEITYLCYKKIKKVIKFDKDDIIIEPSAGNGAFLEIIKKISISYKLYDILPEHDEIIKQDFLNLNIHEFKDYKKIHIIGNPPFGRQSNKAIKFIKKCCEFAYSISFILPKSFKKESMKKYFDLDYHLMCEIEIPNNGFLLNNKEVNVPCVFQIWKFKRMPRLNIEKIDPINFIFVKKSEIGKNLDFYVSIRRVGINAGTISKEIKEKNEQSHYFIKFLKNSSDENIQKLLKVKFNCNNTVGPKSISKPELIAEFNKYLL